MAKAICRTISITARQSTVSMAMLAIMFCNQPYARASDVPSSPTEAAPVSIDSSDTLSEVVVTARRRSENLEHVPVSVTALNAAQLTAQGVASQSDLQSVVPGLVVRQTENQNDFNYAIRGQTVDAFSGSRPAVASYLNEVAISQTSQSSLYD